MGLTRFYSCFPVSRAIRSILGSDLLSGIRPPLRRIPIQSVSIQRLYSVDACGSAVVHQETPEKLLFSSVSRASFVSGASL